MTGMILCAGRGERFKPYTELLPKPALPFLGAPLISYPYHYLKMCSDLHKIVINTHHLAYEMKKQAEKIIKDKTLLFSEEKDLLLTGGGVVKMASLVFEKKDFLVLNGDSVFLHPNVNFLNTVLEVHRSSQAQATLVITSQPYDKNTSFSPVWYEASTKKISLKKKKGFSPALYIGVMALSYSLIKKMPSRKPFHIFQEDFFNEESTKAFYDPQVLWFEIGDLKSYLRSSVSVSQILKQSPYLLKNFLFQDVFSFSHFKEEDFKSLLPQN